jgi:hypothetical protein
MIVWLLDLQLHVQSVTIAIIVVSSNPVGQGILDKTLCDIVCQIFIILVLFFPLFFLKNLMQFVEIQMKSVIL